MNKSSQLNSRNDVSTYVRKLLSLNRYEECEEFLNSPELKGLEGSSFTQTLRSILTVARQLARFSTPGKFAACPPTATYLNGWTKKIDISSECDYFSKLAKYTIDEERSQLYFDRLYTIYQCLENTKKVPGLVIETGVYKGGTLKFIRSILKNQKVVRRLVGFDTFEGHREVGPADVSQTVGDFGDVTFSEVANYLADDTVELIKGDVVETFSEFLARDPDGIALLHLDLDLFGPTRAVLEAASTRVSGGGIIVVDDYGFVTCKGVKSIVDSFCVDFGWNKLHLLSGQCILTRP